jgi:putative effector of murein hydrolase LrgA (UPF0299 family)
MTATSTSGVENTDKFGIKRELTVIPGWAFVLAVAVFILVPALFFGLVWSHPSDAPVPFRILISFLPGTILAFLALMVGYVNRDSGRRGMNRTLWTLLVIFVPNAIGFILYFLLRNPIRSECPKCGTGVDLGANYCPGCGYSFHPTCPQCRSAVRTRDTFCANCGMKLI